MNKAYRDENHKKNDEVMNLSAQSTQPIFIMGTARSGTTLMAKILGNHSRIFMPGETHFFDDIYARRKELGDPHSAEARGRIIERLRTLYKRYNEPCDQERVKKVFADLRVLDHLKNSCLSYRDIFAYFMEIQLKYVGKVRWGNNVPKDIFHIKEIEAFFPGSKVIVCVRDTRDFLLSYQHKWKVTAPENVDRIRSLYHPILTTLIWKSSIYQIKTVDSVVKRQNLKLVRYESLVENPIKVVSDMSTFIGEEFEEGMLEIKTHNSSFSQQEHGIFSSSVGRWRKELAKEDAYLAQKMAWKQLRQLGYSLEDIEFNPLRLTWRVATFPYALGKALRANRRNSGPLIPYLVRRVIPFLR